MEYLEAVGYVLQKNKTEDNVLVLGGVNVLAELIGRSKKLALKPSVDHGFVSSFFHRISTNTATLLAIFPVEILYNSLVHNYYIKVVYAPMLDHALRVGEDCTLHFAEAEKRNANKFAESVGFLVYETGRRHDAGVGTKSIFARGAPSSFRYEYVDNPPEVDGHKYPLGVKVEIEKRVKPENGVLLERVRELVPRLQRNTFQSHGGLIGISREEFVVLKEELEKCS